MAYRRRYGSTGPRTMTSNRAGTCATCGKAFPAGTDILWDPSKREAHHASCVQDWISGINAERSYSQYGNDLYYER